MTSIPNQEMDLQHLQRRDDSPMNIIDVSENELTHQMHSNDSEVNVSTDAISKVEHDIGQTREKRRESLVFDVHFSRDSNKKELEQECLVEIPSKAREGDLIELKWESFKNRKIVVIVPSVHDRYIIKDKEGKKRTLIRVHAPFDPSDPNLGKEIDLEKINSIELSPLRRKRTRKRVFSDEDHYWDYSDEKENDDDSVNIGDNYQVLPSKIPNVDDRLRFYPTEELYEQIWDPKQIPESELSSVMTLIENLPSNHKEIMMECLHNSSYNLDEAWEKFLDQIAKLKRAGKLPGEPLSAKEALLAYDAIWDTRKNVRKAYIHAKRKGFRHDFCTFLVHYYEHFKTGKLGNCYHKLKELLKKESDYCKICDDGGDLICCDSCGDVYHAECLSPPLRVIPKGRWYCPKCKSSLAYSTGHLH